MVLDGEGVDAEDDGTAGLVTMPVGVRLLKGDQGADNPRLDLRACLSGPVNKRIQSNPDKESRWTY